MRRCQQFPEFYIAAGFRTDCQTLLRRFADTNSVRYSEFSAIWRDLKFSLIFCGRKNLKELNMFTEEALRIAKGFWLPPQDFQTRVGGLYLLYGLYFKQPKDIKAKIRVTRGEFSEVVCWLNDLEEQEHFDALYIFWKMMACDAFHFVFCITEMKPHMGDNYAQNDNSAPSTCFLEGYVQDPQLEQLRTLHDKYVTMKSEMVLADKSGLQMIDTNMFTTISRLIEDYSKRKAMHPGSSSSQRAASGAESNGDEDDGDEDYSTDIGVRRAQIKQKQYSKVSSVSKSRRHRQTELTEISSPKKSVNYEPPSMKLPFSGFVRITGPADKNRLKRGRRRLIPDAENSDDNEDHQTIHSGLSAADAACVTDMGADMPQLEETAHSSSKKGKKNKKKMAVTFEHDAASTSQEPSTEDEDKKKKVGTKKRAVKTAKKIVKKGSPVKSKVVGRQKEKTERGKQKKRKTTDSNEIDKADGDSETVNTKKTSTSAVGKTKRQRANKGTAEKGRGKRATDDNNKESSVAVEKKESATRKKRALAASVKEVKSEPEDEPGVRTYSKRKRQSAPAASGK